MVQGISRIHEMKHEGKRGHMHDQVKFMAESDFRKGGRPSGY